MTRGNDGMSLFRLEANSLDRPIHMTGLRKKKNGQVTWGRSRFFVNYILKSISWTQSAWKSHIRTKNLSYSCSAWFQKSWWGVVFSSSFRSMLCEVNALMWKTHTVADIGISVFRIICTSFMPFIITFFLWFTWLCGDSIQWKKTVYLKSLLIDKAIWHRWQANQLSMEHLQNDTDRRKPKYSEKTLSQNDFAHHKFHMDWSGIESRLPP